MSDSSCCPYCFPKLEDKKALEHGKDLAPKFLTDGTIPAITTDAQTGEVLMFAYMNSQSLALSIETGIAHYWSRSRQSLWRKGETSGNEQEIKEIRVDCDQDVILLKVDVRGSGASCHNGYHSCFYRSVKGIGQKHDEASLEFSGGEPLFDPKEVY